MTIELEDGKPPEWMIALENKQKRQHKLAHEIGAGAPCLNCNDGCSGLDLHFWRKICRNCKCKKEVHDVKEENSYEQFDILFGDNLKCSDRVKQLSLNLKFKLDDILNAKEAEFKDAKDTKSDNDLVFDWIPTDVPVNLASEYLQQLPLEKLPITGSAGAMFRRQQLQKQMPLHDFKVNSCHDLTDEEAKAFTEYVDNLKNNAVGKGQITKILSEDDISSDTPANHTLKLPTFSTNLNSSPKPFKSSYDNKPDDNLDTESFPPPPPELLHHDSGSFLKTPSAFVPYKQLNELLPKPQTQIVPAESAPYTIQNINYNKLKENSTPISGLAAEYSQMNLNRSNQALDTENNNWYENDEENHESLKPSDIIRKFNTKPSPQITNGYTKNVPYNRNISPLNEVVKNVDGKFLKLGTPEQFQALSSYIPRAPQVSNTLVNHSLKNAPINDSKKSKVHFGPTTVYSDAIDPHQQIGRMDQSCITQNCHQCKVPVYPGQVVILAERAGVEVIWHPQCFICVSCQELLVDLIYFFHKGDVYCGRHYAEVLKIPRCYACDELIFLKEYTVAEGQSFHVKHFCCFECDIPLAGMQYVPKDNNPVCLSCYEAKYGKKCHCCDKIIKVGDSRVGWKELSWHATPICFKCVQCSKSLLGGKFVVKNESPLCSKECALKLQAAC